MKDIANNKPLYDDVVEMVLDVVCTTEASPKRDALEDNVNDAVRRWDILSKNAENRMRQLNRIEPLAAEYENTKHEFFRWLTDTESAIKEVPTDAVDQISLPKYLEKIKVKKDLNLPSSFIPNTKLFSIVVQRYCKRKTCWSYNVVLLY